jgi:hypothetical protein
MGAFPMSVADTETMKSGMETENAMRMKPIASCDTPVYSEIDIEASMTHFEDNIRIAMAMMKTMAAMIIMVYYLPAPE